MASLRRSGILAGALVLSLVSMASAGVVINEVDYDQPGTDTAEYLELYNCGTDPVDLTGWTVELVNGNGGGAVIYLTIPLSGVLAGGDYFVICANGGLTPNCDLDVTPDTNLIQNGAPDGIGLRNAGGALVDALSYEGDTGAPYTEGSGVGLEDPGLTTSVNVSIGRVPNGRDTNVNNVDFVQGTSTPGAPNGPIASECEGTIPVETRSWGTVKSHFGS